MFFPRQQGGRPAFFCLQASLLHHITVLAPSSPAFFAPQCIRFTNTTNYHHLYITLNAFIEAIKVSLVGALVSFHDRPRTSKSKQQPQAHDASRCLSRISRTPPPPCGTLVLKPLHFQNVVSFIRNSGRKQSSTTNTFRSCQAWRNSLSKISISLCRDGIQTMSTILFISISLWITTTSESSTCQGQHVS